MKEIAVRCGSSVLATSWTVRCLDHDGRIIRLRRTRSQAAQMASGRHAPKSKRWRLTTKAELKLIQKLNRARRHEIDLIADGKVSCDLPAEVPPPPEPVQLTVQVEAPAKRRIVVRRKPENLAPRES